MDPSTAYARAARIALANAVVVVDRFSPGDARQPGSHFNTGDSWPGLGAAEGAEKLILSGVNATGCCGPRRTSPRMRWPRCSPQSAALTPPVGWKSAGK
ncbi:hypothetical protein EH165_10710 [Nakamurella antarctica]|uniref:Uncharacterized protein n=1 Tax=Nakamurella antarctica TaxID=1902245 RepID=A0A3G8ZMQ4_9ACTN|nr:hypothetical protein EH165_10710 [Nakamurella antarctica]